MIASIALAAAATAPCRVENARYALRHSPGVTAYFRAVDSGSEWPSGVALAIHDRRSRRTFWWLPWNGGTNNLQNVASTTDVTASDWRPPSPDGGPRPYGDRQFLSMDAAYDVLPDIPRRGARAPAHMLFPDSAGSHDPAFAQKQFFDLTGCPAGGR